LKNSVNIDNFKDELAKCGIELKINRQRDGSGRISGLVYKKEVVETCENTGDERKKTYTFPASKLDAKQMLELLQKKPITYKTSWS